MFFPHCFLLCSLTYNLIEPHGIKLFIFRQKPQQYLFKRLSGLNGDLTGLAAFGEPAASSRTRHTPLQTPALREGNKVENKQNKNLFPPELKAYF